MQWSVSWYVAGEDGDSALNVFAPWDDFIVSKSNAMAKDIECHFHEYKGVFDCLEQLKLDRMNYELYHLHAAASENHVIDTTHMLGGRGLFKEQAVDTWGSVVNILQGF